MILVVWSLSGCGPDSATALRDGLARQDCSGVPDDAVRDQCWVAVGVCAPIQGRRAAAECAFREAEARGDPARCADAGPWVDDCRLHLWTGSFATWAPADTRPGDAEEQAARELARFGFAADDPRPWSAWYRWVLSRTQPFDRQACHRVADGARAEACLQTGLSAYSDLLHMARDRRLYPCDGGPLPDFLQHTPDPELDALRTERTDLCPR